MAILPKSMIKNGVLTLVALVSCALTASAARAAVSGACGELCGSLTTISGSIDGGLTVPAGQCYLLSSATVNGGVSVQAGGALLMQGATINGSVDSTGANVIQICASTVHGPTSVQQNTCPVTIGDPDDVGGLPCAGNVLHGPVTLNGNATDVELGGNSISGAVSFNGNGVGGAAVFVIEANDISGPLGCSGKTPAPTNDGLPNTVAGPESGDLRRILTATGVCEGDTARIRI